jgi:hypothetical protein
MPSPDAAVAAAAAGTGIDAATAAGALPDTPPVITGNSGCPGPPLLGPDGPGPATAAAWPGPPLCGPCCPIGKRGPPGGRSGMPARSTTKQQHEDASQR